jgi:hypothetical protein
VLVARERTSIYCERCGTVVPVGDRSPGPHYCAGCQSYICSTCWNGSALRCVGCAGGTADGGPLAGTRGVRTGRRILRDLESVRPELDALSAREEADAPLDDPHLQRRLLRIKAESAAEAALASIEDVRAPDARSLRQSIELERLRVAAIAPTEPEPRRFRLPAIPLPRLSFPRWSFPRLSLPRLSLPTLALPRLSLPRVSFPRLSLPRLSLPTLALPRLSLPHVSFPGLSVPRLSLPTLALPRLSLPRLSLPRVSVPVARLVAGTAGAVAIAVIVVAAVLFRGSQPSTPLGVVVPLATPTPEGRVAGGRSSLGPLPSPTARLVQRSTFDELVMGSALPAAFSVQADGGSAGVAPFPNAVDRSLQLISSPSGAPTRLCHAVPGGTAQLLISVDLHAARPFGVSVLLRLSDGVDGVGVRVGEDGSPVLEPGGGSLPVTIGGSGWSRLTFAIDPIRSLVHVTVGTGSQSGEADVALPLSWPSADDSAQLCIGSPQLPQADLFVDNLVIE